MQLLVALALIALALTGVLWLSQSLRFFDLIVNRGLDVGTFLWLIGLLLPNYLVLILPVAVACAVMFTYSRFLMDRELVVLAACGAGPIRIIMPVVLVGGAVTALCFWLTLTLIPESHRMFRELQWEIRYNVSQVLIEAGTFTDITDRVTVYVRERSDNGVLRGIFVHSSDENNEFTMLAAEGSMQEASQGPRIVLLDGSRQQIDDTGSLSILYFDRYVLDLQRLLDAPAERYRRANERSLTDLLDVENDPSVQQHDRGPFMVEAHRRLTAPLSALGYGLVGVLCMTSGQFRRGPPLRRNILATLMVAAIALASLGSENVAARDTRLIPLLYACALLPMIGSLAWLLWTSRRRTVVRAAAAEVRA